MFSLEISANLLAKLSSVISRYLGMFSLEAMKRSSILMTTSVISRYLGMFSLEADDGLSKELRNEVISRYLGMFSLEEVGELMRAEKWSYFPLSWDVLIRPVLRNPYF